MTGTEIKKIRETLAMTRSQLGEQLGVTPTTIYRWETGRSPVSKITVLALHQLVHVINDLPWEFS